MSTTDYIRKEAFWTLCGKKIGSGCYRKVYECSFDNTLVVKVESRSQCFSNILEWTYWGELHWMEGYKEWLAPCVQISPSGGVLIQKKIEPIRRNELPKKLPQFLTDIKPENFGMYEGRLVCCDYGSILCDWSKKLKKIEDEF